VTSYAEWWGVADAAAGALLYPLVLWILLSGVDDLFIDAVAILARHRFGGRGRVPARRDLLRRPQSPIAVFVPCWQEASVISSMVDRNKRQIGYSNYEFFIGAYPNDEATTVVVEALERRHANVHLAMCPHSGPTSKADCLNWIYQRMLLHEAARGVWLDIIVTHDAEDVIHTDAFHWINFYSEHNDMVQVPVLPLPTPVGKWTHGVYCDEFAEYQSRDMPARQYMGAFVPSSGVGTGFRRDALERLARAEGNRIFEPVCLTEDYENGFRLRKYGSPQCFVPLVLHGVATREFFPQTFSAAVRQRTRWVTGIALQTWDRHGWGGGVVQRYWLWRDRKGLIGNPASLLANVLFLYYALAALAGHIPENLIRLHGLLTCTGVLSGYRLLYRAYWSSRHFGWRFAPTLPVRVALANVINSCACARAFWRFVKAKRRREPLVWVKTEHQYPSAATLQTARLRLGEMLVKNGYITPQDLRLALERKPAGLRLGEFLVSQGLIGKEDLYEALSLQQGIPQRHVDPEEVRTAIARSLPGRITSEWKVLPYKVDAGTLVLAGPELPTPEAERAVRAFTRLEVEFHLVTQENYEELVVALL
jgi:adsorption protein B